MEDKIIIRIDRSIKDEYNKLCKDLGTKMSEDIRGYISSMIDINEYREDA